MSGIKRKGSNRHKAYGMTAELNRKINAKYPKELDMQCREWIEMMVGENITWGIEHEYSKPGDALADAIDDGVFLCRIVNEVRSDTIKKIHRGDKINSFQKQENIQKFLEACTDEPFNCIPADLFPTVYLFERQNMGQVVSGIQAFARRAHQYDKTVPLFGPKQNEKNPRNFPDYVKSYRGDQ